MSQVLKGAQVILPVAKKILSGAGQESKSILGYNFLNLMMGLAVYFVAGILIEKYMVLSLGLSSIGNSLLAGLLAIIGKTVPQMKAGTGDKFLLQFFSPTGFNGVNYWKVVQFGAIVFVAWEALNYYNANRENPSIVTMFVFGMIEALLLLTTIPDLVNKIQESQILNKVM